MKRKHLSILSLLLTLALLLGSLNTVFGTADGKVIMQGRILNLLQGISLSRG